MIDFRQYDKYKKARDDNNISIVDAMEKESPSECGIYKDIYNYEQLKVCMAVMEAQRREEADYQKFCCKYGTGIISGSLPESGFRLNKQWDFFERFCREHCIEL